jgi:hypothetical protein
MAMKKWAGLISLLVGLIAVIVLGGMVYQRLLIDSATSFAQLAQLRPTDNRHASISIGWSKPQTVYWLVCAVASVILAAEIVRLTILAVDARKERRKFEIDGQGTVNILGACGVIILALIFLASAK